MSIDYDGSPNGLFRLIGSVIKEFNSVGSSAATKDGDWTTIAATLEAGGKAPLSDGVEAAYLKLLEAHTGLRQYLASIASRLLTDQSIATELRTGQNIASVLAALISRMIVDAETVDANTCAVSTLSKSSTGNGRLLWTNIIDGVTNPSGGKFPVRANRSLYGVKSEVVQSDTLVFTATGDSYSGGLVGKEPFQVSTAPVVYGGPTGCRTEGSGESRSLVAANATNILAATTGTFETFSSNVPSGWTVVTGTAGTHIKQSTSQFFNGAGSLELVGTGAQAAIAIKTPIYGKTTSTLKRMCILAAVKAGVASGNLSIGLTGTGWSHSSPTVGTQDVAVSGTPTGGDFTLTILGSTITVPVNTSSASLQTLIRAVAGLEALTVATQAGSVPDITYRISFNGFPSDAPLATVDYSGLTGGTPVVAVSRTTNAVEGNRIYIQSTSLPTGWSVLATFFTLPAVIPTDLALEIRWDGTPAAGSLYIDDVIVCSPEWINGAGFVMAPGQTPFVIGDSFTVAMTNDGAGTFQEFFRKVFGVQLPSNTSGSETIADSLAE